MNWEVDVYFEDGRMNGDGKNENKRKYKNYLLHSKLIMYRFDYKKYLMASQ